MVRFIFLCMGVVALSFVAIGAQHMMQDMQGAQDSVMARNIEVPDITAQPEDTIESAAAQADGFSPEDLNQIETSAGAMADTQEDAGFGAAFTNTAPKALADDMPAPTVPDAMDTESTAN